jgi:antitoxin PrlF
VAQTWNKTVSIFDPPHYKSDAQTSEFERVVVPYFELAMDEHGCVVIPAELRASLLVENAGVLIAEVVDGELRLISPKAALRKVGRLIAEQDWGTDSVVQELLLEHRAEVLRDYAESLLPTYEW